MDPFTAIAALANMITAITNAGMQAQAGMTPEQRKLWWDGYLADMAVWRALWKPLTDLILKAAAKP